MTLLINLFDQAGIKIEFEKQSIASKTANRSKHTKVGYTTCCRPIM